MVKAKTVRMAFQGLQVARATRGLVDCSALPEFQATTATTDFQALLGSKASPAWLELSERLERRVNPVPQARRGTMARMECSGLPGVKVTLARADRSARQDWTERLMDSCSARPRRTCAARAGA